MPSFLLGCLLFFGVHSVSIVAPQWRDRMVARLGLGPWQGLYSLISIAGFVLMLHGYGLARVDSTWLYVPPGWSRHLAYTLMLPVFVLLLAAYLPGRIGQTVRHPMLLATVLWSAAHLLTNGRVVDVILFAAFGLWALIDMVSLHRRPARPIRRLPAGKWNDAASLLLGLVLYVVFATVLHGPVTGVPLM